MISELIAVFFRIIFEQNQADLEHATEELSGYLERDSNDMANVTEMKQKVQDKYRYCNGRRKVLLDHVAEGYERDYWFVRDLSCSHSP
jgi:ariadne-1